MQFFIKRKASIILFVIVIILSYVSCSNYKKEKSVPFNGKKLVITLEGIDNKNIDSETRTAGNKSKSGYVVSLKAGDRKPIVVIEDFSRDCIPSSEELDKILQSISVKKSPHNQHIALWKNGTDKYITFYHLMRKGVPFTVPEHNERVLVKDAEKLDWGMFKPARSIAKKHLIMNLSAKDYYSINNNYLWDAIGEQNHSSGFDDIVLNLWPHCTNTHILVENFVKKDSGVSDAWRQILDSRIAGQLSGSPSSSILLVILRLSQIMKNEEFIKRGLMKSLGFWPDSPGITEYYDKNFKSFPDNIKKAVFAKGKKFLDTKNSMARRNALALLRKYLPCKELIKLQKYFSQSFTLRDECK